MRAVILERPARLLCSARLRSSPSRPDPPVGRGNALPEEILLSLGMQVIRRPIAGVASCCREGQVAAERTAEEASAAMNDPRMMMNSSASDQQSPSLWYLHGAVVKEGAKEPVPPSSIDTIRGGRPDALPRTNPPLRRASAKKEAQRRRVQEGAGQSHAHDRRRQRLQARAATTSPLRRRRRRGSDQARRHHKKGSRRTTTTVPAQRFPASRRRSAPPGRKPTDAERRGGRLRPIWCRLGQGSRSRSRRRTVHHCQSPGGLPRRARGL